MASNPITLTSPAEACTLTKEIHFEPKASPLRLVQADELLPEHFRLYPITSEHMRDVISSLQGALISHTHGEPGCAEVQLRQHTKVLTSDAMEGQLE